MALIHCPECGKDVSDKAPVCIHCGYPLQEQQGYSDPNAPKKVVVPIHEIPQCQKLHAINIVREITGNGLAYAKAFVEQPSSEAVIKDGLSQSQADFIAQKFKSIGITVKICNSSKYTTASICCPKCGSTEYHAGARGYSLFTEFIGSGKTVLTCLRCGHRWEPGT